MKVHVVLVTKGKKESKGLAEKLTQCFAGSDFEAQILCVYKHTKDELMSRFGDHAARVGCALVIPDSHQKINRSTRVVKKAKKAFRQARCYFDFGLILDECDVILDRTPDNSQINELEMKKLKDLRAVLWTLVTATPLPIAVRQLGGLRTKDEPFPKLFLIVPNKDYVGVKAHRPLRNQRNEEVYLDVQSLMKGFRTTYKPGFASSKDNKPVFRDDRRHKPEFRVQRKIIPIWNEQCCKLLDSAFSLQESGKAKGQLMLVGTCTRTLADENIFQQALGVQDFCYAKDRPFVAVCVHADKICYKLPGQKDWFKCKHSRFVDEFIRAIDDDPRFGLKMMIVIFGYHKLKRSISYRSSKRVPTHYLS